MLAVSCNSVLLAIEPDTCCVTFNTEVAPSPLSLQHMLADYNEDLARKHAYWCAWTRADKKQYEHHLLAVWR